MKYKMREDGTAGVPSSLLKIASGFETQRYVVIPEVSSERLKSNYGFEIKTTTKTSCAAKLMKMYQEARIKLLKDENGAIKQSGAKQ